MGRVHRILRWIVFTIGGVIGVLTILVLGGPSIRSWQMERAIARFEKRPSQSGADSLVELLHMHAATGEQGKRALALLLRPKIVTRRAYAVGQLVTIGVERPFDLDFDKFLWSKGMVTVSGPAGTPWDSSDTLEHGSSCLDVPILSTQPGTYPLELRIQCSLGIERASRATTVLGYLHDGLPWLVPDMAMWRPSRTYECDFMISSEVTITGDSDAEKVELVSSPELDEAMRAAFSARYLGRRFVTPAGRHSVHITYRNIPVAAAFSITLRLPDGREVPMRRIGPGAFSARAGSSGSFMAEPANFVVKTPDQYKATLVLVPDPDLAYRDVTIKSIWNRMLEFPISFTIDANEPGR